MKLGSVLLLLWLLIGQTVLVAAELHQSHMNTAVSSYTPVDGGADVTRADTAGLVDVLDFLAAYDCQQHCCHCHNMTPVLALSLDMPVWYLPYTQWPRYRASHVSPDLSLPKKPPIA